MGTNEIRLAFLEYFRDKSHEIVPSSPLIPANDPTLLFTNAGMVQFKDLFLGNESRSYVRAATAQRCVRAGGKHNDLDNVGYTARHHTFFEMLGNFSFGDYFKQEAIEYAWDFLISVIEIPEQRLWITVFKDDDEAADIWLKKIGISEKRFSRCGEKDNFWTMGDTGPCGPCSEIFYDHGEHIPGTPPGTSDSENDRYVEIWNIVFTQFDRNTDGKLIPIQKPSVDTGMGLERLAAVKQGVHSNYDIDIFKQLISEIAAMSGKVDHQVTSQRVIADHIRSSACLIADGVVPTNEGRGYVLRRIIRRAVRHGNKLGIKGQFFNKLVSTLNEVMGSACPELENKLDFVQKTLLQEERRFAETLDNGLERLEEAINELKDNTISGEVLFKLYDTYGFPVDLVGDIARERNFKLNMDGFNTYMAEQRNRAKAASKFDMNMSVNDGSTDHQSSFNGYVQLTAIVSISALYRDGGTVQSLKKGEIGGVILDSTPFYAESGGQVGDSGLLLAEGVEFRVTDTKKQGKAHVHIGTLEQGTIKVGQQVHAEVDSARRQDIVRNHSAAHLLHAALRELLGTHITQKGSLVAPDRLRFDFSNPELLSDAQLAGIEDLVNQKTLENKETDIEVMALEEAKKSGAMSLFGEKYEEQVRVLTIGGDFSIELCGGTHVSRSGDIGLFKIVSESGIAAGIRRIEAVTGVGAIQWVRDNESLIASVAKKLKSDPTGLEAKVEQLLERNRKYENEIEQLQSKMASSAGSDMAAEAEEISGVKVIARTLENIEPKMLRDTVDQLKSKLGTAAIVLATVENDKVSLIAGVTKDTTDRLKAGDLVNFVAQQVGGKGGGRADMAQAGGNDPSGLDEAMTGVPNWVKNQLDS